MLKRERARLLTAPEARGNPHWFLVASIKPARGLEPRPDDYRSPVLPVTPRWLC